MCIAKILLYKEGGRNLCYVNIVFHNNLVFGNALLNKKKCQQWRICECIIVDVFFKFFKLGQMKLLATIISKRNLNDWILNHPLPFDEKNWMLTNLLHAHSCNISTYAHFLISDKQKMTFKLNLCGCNLTSQRYLHNVWLSKILMQFDKKSQNINTFKQKFLF